MKKYIVKLGGSIITDRDHYCTSKMHTIDRLCMELSKAKSIEDFKMILIIGAGSYGHQTIHDFDLHHGYKNREQLFALKTLTMNMWENGNIISKKLAEYDIPSYCIHTPSYLVSNNGEVDELFYTPIKRCLDCGIIPIVWGEINFDKTMGFTNVSGDKIAVSLSELFEPDWVYSFTDVDGVLKNFGSENEAVVSRVSKANYNNILQEIKASKKIDVNGGMLIKYDCMCRLMLSGSKGYIGNGEKEGLVYDAIVNQSADGTYFIR